MRRLYLAAHTEVDPVIADELQRRLGDALGHEVARTPPVPLPESAFDALRRQYGSAELLRFWTGRLPADCLRLLAVTDRDVFIPMLSFLFGHALLGGPVALVSLARLRQEFYGLPPDPALLAERALKESFHELGHTLGLTHCTRPTCAMSLSTALPAVDGKQADYCPECDVLVHRSIVREALGD